MEVTGIHFTPSLRITFKPEEVDTLITIGSHHYDGKCQDSTKQGGFIYGWRNRLAGELGEVEASSGQIDTCLKILEMSPFGNNEETKKIASQLNSSLWKAFRALSEVYTEVNSDE